MDSSIPFSAAMFEAIGEPIAIGRPVSIEGEIVDVEIVWMSASLRELAIAANITSMRLSEVYPEMVDSGWLEELVIARATGRPSTRFRPRQLEGQVLEVIEITARWAGDWLVATVHNLSTRASSNADMIRAAAMVTEMMAANPVFARILLPNQTLEFSTRAWLEGRSGIAATFDEMVLEEERERVETWQATPVHEREPVLMFRAHHGNGQVRWYSVHAEVIAETGIEVQVVSDVDHYLRETRASERLARDLHGQLEVLTSALDASTDGFAIWRAQRNERGEIMTFMLEFMNTVGAAPTGLSPDLLVNRTIESVVGPEQSEGLKAAFALVIQRNEPQVRRVTVDSPAGWVGTFENRVAPIGHDCVVASFRLVP
ncbi:MAG TPA: hypothetical protein VK139_05975 [Microbacteriaceae bacterium]|nr:hypothetical protein [Microbacteriaceae bacterium]